MNSYVEMVRHRFVSRHDNIVLNIEKLDESQLRFTMRLFGDCLDGEKRKELMSGYSEYLTEPELREFTKDFLPLYLECAISELEEKKKGGERFDPPHLTQEEYQEMAPREKWPRIAGNLEHVTPRQLAREIARMALLFRPYMLSDPGFSEGVLEFALYFDLLDRLSALSLDALRGTAAEIAPMVERAVAASAPGDCEEILRGIRRRAASAAGIEAEPESLLGPEMERYPREAPPGWKLRELTITLASMNLKELRISALSHIDLLTVEETRAIVTPFVSRYPSFFEISSKGLREIVLAIAERVTDRAITFFSDRYTTGRMAMTPAISYLVWKLMPEGERLACLRRDNEAMDQSMMSRHLARYLISSSFAELSDGAAQLSFLTEPGFPRIHGTLLKNLGGEGDGRAMRLLYDAVTERSVQLASLDEAERGEAYGKIREMIADAAGLAGLPGKTTEGGA